MTEKEAIARLKQGDVSGLEFLVHQYQTEALRTVYIITRDRAMAEDIVQTAFVRAYERIDQFDTQRSFRPWFLRSIINDALKMMCRQHRQISLETTLAKSDFSLRNFLVSSDPGPADQAEQANVHQIVWQALGNLSPVQRAAIVQRYYLELSEKEMATIADCAPGTIKWRLHIARKRLYELLCPLEL